MTNELAKLQFWKFSQNNSGGVFLGPAHYVFIEALDSEDAVRRAEDKGLYFNGCLDGRDCSCCGDRWYKPWHDDGSDEPEVYGVNVLEDDTSRVDSVAKRLDDGNLPFALVVRADGTEVVVL